MKFRFREFKNRSENGQSGPDSESATQRRRAQVRNAQRTHRERKEAYTKALETEVLQLRSNEENLLHETRNLYEEVGRLKALLELNETQPPQLADRSTTPKPQGSDVTLSVEHYHKHKRIAVSKLAMQDEPRPPWTIAPHAPHGQITRPPEPKSVEGRNSNNKNSGQTRKDGNASDSPSPAAVPNEIILGTEFVLSLESPCLSHMESIAKDSSAPPGHVLTLSAPLIFSASAGSVAQKDGWSVPQEGLERLLSLSSSLPLADEVTPVQAWDYLRRHAAFQALGVDGLRSLASKLVGKVECHGFGAVIGLDVFESLVREVLVAGELF